MQKPDYSEDQLQILTNMEIFLRTGHLPVVRSRNEERFLGWDTGFYIPWTTPPARGQHGCNIFIQYKRSNYFDNPRVPQWGDWNESFLRFDMTYESGADTNQRDNLIRLSNQYRVAYVTCQYMDEIYLMGAFYMRHLWYDLPVLRVSNALTGHRYVSYTADSDHFQLHSEQAQAEKHDLESLFIDELTATDIVEDIEFLGSFLSIHEGHLSEINKNKDRPFAKAFERFRGQENYMGSIRLLSYYLYRYLRLKWFRVPV